MSRAYGYWKLQLFEGKLSVPLKLYLANESEYSKKIPIVQGYNGQVVKTKKVVPKEGLSEILSIDDVDEIIEWTDVQDHMYDKDKVLKRLEEFDGLVELIEEHKNKKKDRNMEVIAILDKEDIDPFMMNGRQFYCNVGSSSKEKIPPANDIKIYNTLMKFLEENNKYIHVRFHSSCSTAEELGALYNKDGVLCISGFYSNNDIRTVPVILKTDVDDKLLETLSNKLGKFYNKFERSSLYKLEWYSFYLESLSEKGHLKKSIQKKEKNYQENNTSNLLDILDSI